MGEGSTRPWIAERFLQAAFPDGPWKLTEIARDRRGVDTRTFSPGGEEVMKKWIADRNGAGANIYFELGVSNAKAANKKSTGADMQTARALWCDIDCGPDRVSEVLNLCVTGLHPALPRPSLAINSGNGVWPIWLLEKPTEDLDRVEAINKVIAEALAEIGGDNCHNRDRIARLPGTVNWPDAKKSKLGRVAVGSNWFPYSRDPKLPERVSLGAFSRFAETVGPITANTAPKKKSAAVVASDHPLLQPGDRTFQASGDVAQDLRDFGLDPSTISLISDGIASLDCKTRERKADKGADTTGSGYAWQVYCDFARARVPFDVAVGVLFCSDYAISKWHVLKRKTPNRLLAHDFPNAVAKVAEDAPQIAVGEPVRAESGAAESGFVRDKNGLPVAKHQHNVRLAVDALGVTVRQDLFTDRRLIEGLEGVGPWLDDAALNRLWLAIDEQFGMLPPIEFFVTVVADYARRNAFHPVRDYLDRVQPTWDGRPRIDGWLVEYGGAEDTEFTRAVSALTLVAAVRRARQPGSKFDEMLVLEGPQGVGKSSAIEALMPDSQWFSDNFSFTLRDREAIEQLAGRWIIEAPELKGMRKSESETRKAFMSRQTDRGRLAYARTVTEVPRTCIFIGTTNDDRYLTDTTGNRRFWPVRVRSFDVEAIRRDRDQLWAEAATREARGAPIRLQQELWQTAATVQHTRRVEDPWTQILANAVGDMEGKIDPLLIWNIVGVDTGRRTQADNERLGAVMRDLGWERRKRRLADYDTSKWCYVRGESKEEIRLELHEGRWVATKELPF